MWDKIKKALAWIAGAVIGLLLAVIGIKNWKIKKTEKKADDLEKEAAAVKEAEIIEESFEKTAESVETAADEKIAAVRKATGKKLAEAAVDTSPSYESYNQLVEEWNNEEE